MNSNKLQSLRNRIRRAQTSLSVMGEMVLDLEIDLMTPEERKDLQKALLSSKSPIVYKYLNARIERETATTICGAV